MDNCVCDHVILFAHPRSGSSSLHQILQLHPELNILEEPFNEHFIEWNPDNKDYHSIAGDIPSLDAQLVDIFNEYSGVKVLNYQLADELAVHLLQRSDCKIIFLRRRNILQSVVSWLLAEQTQLWKRWELLQPFDDYYRNLQPLDVIEIQRRIVYLREHMDFFENIVDRLPKRKAIKVTYEELYFASPKQRQRLFDKIWKFLNINPLPQIEYQNYALPEIAKINSGATYSLIPNIDEIRACCGNDETGRL